MLDFVDGLTEAGAPLLLSGAPGTGKSVLLDVAADAARARGVRVVRTSGVEFEADLSYAGLGHVYDQLTPYSADPSPELRTPLLVALGLAIGPRPERLVVCNAALELVRSTSAHAPLLVVVDDVQWLDRASATVLGFLTRRLAGTRAGLLVSIRAADEGDSTWARLPRVELDRLDEASSGNLLDSRHPRLADEVRRRVLELADGNPLALLELPKSLTADQRDALEPLPASLPLTSNLQAVFAGQIRDLPERTRESLLIAALDGGNTDRETPAETQTGDWLTELGPAEEAQLVRLESGRVTFRHPLIRSTVVARSTAPERRHAHRMLAAVRTNDPVRRAWHLAAAATAPDEETAGLLERAADLTQARGDVSRAGAALTRAAELSPAAADRGRRLAKAAYLGTRVTGDGSHRSDIVRRIDELDPDSDGALYAAAAGAHLLLNRESDVDTPHAVLCEVIARHAPSLSPTDKTLADALGVLGGIGFNAGRADLWEPFHELVAGLGPAAPMVLRLRDTMWRDAAHVPTAHVEELDRAIVALENERDPEQVVTVAGLGTWIDRIAACRPRLWSLVEAGRQGEATLISLPALGMLSLDSFLCGEWTACQQLNDEALHLRDTLGDDVIRYQNLFHRALLAAGQGDEALLDTMTEKMYRWGAARRMRLPEQMATYACSLAAIGRGDFEEAYGHASRLSPPATFAPHSPLAMWAVLDLVEASVRTGRTAEATAHVAAAHEIGLGALSSRLGLLVGGAAALAQQGPAAEDLFAAALAAPGAERWRFEYARVQLCYGEWLRRRKATSRARDVLESAYEQFSEMGARPWVARAKGELRATSGRSARFGAALTPQELQIANLAAQGLTNKEIGQKLFLSPRTVSTLLYRIFPKLGIKSRAGLRDALSSAGS
ncbi:LuxR family transcriptional regulator [Pseudonocardia ailaonensis]|uniref:LuxR family transcriptional regulator n=1 Tax=Pseudonocardia ailaonensis TaxID=367279 RepID=A0ABN2MIP8_9PSEU